MATNHEKKFFKPRRSTGWIWVAIIGVVVLGIGISLIVSSGLKGPFIFPIIITILIGTGSLLLAVFFPSMRYELDGERLVLKYGPFLRYVIEIQQIKSIRSRDLGVSMVSSFRFPGLALFNVPYPEVGVVKMCATAASNGILVIETGSARYGMTPANEQDFVAELRKRIEN